MMRKTYGAPGKNQKAEGAKTTNIQTVQKQKAKSFSTQINDSDHRPRDLNPLQLFNKPL